MLENEKRGRSAAEPADNGLSILILQHPQEKKEALATAALTCTVLANAELVIGLSWPNLARAMGRAANPRRWAVLYLGSARPEALGGGREIIALDRRGEPSADQDGVLRGLDGIVLLDGSWSEVKTLWWRNPWLLKLRRLVLNPQQRSQYGRLRREPRRAALSTLEAAAVLFRHLNGGSGAEAALFAALDRLIAEARPSRSGSKSGSGHESGWPPRRLH